MKQVVASDDVSRRWWRRSFLPILIHKEENKKMLSMTTEATENSSSISGSSFPRPHRISSLDLSSSDLHHYLHWEEELEPSRDPLVGSLPDQLARRVAKLEDEVKSESFQIRRNKRRERICKAREDYLECLGALKQTALSVSSLDLDSSNSTATTTKLSQASDDFDEFFTANGLLDWKGYEL